MSKDSIFYPELIDAAMRGVVREVMRSVAKTGLPGEHHFYITFDTNAPGVKISDSLKTRYPEEMTIVLQHQFWDFKVEDTQFTASLSFNGVPEKLIVPFAAITAFADPSVRFGLQFQPAPEEDDSLALPIYENVSVADDAEKPEAAQIISLDAFRKK